MSFTSTIGDLFGHSTRVLDGVEPLVPWYLCFGEVFSRHGTHGSPHALGQAVDGLSADGGANDLGLLAVYPVTSLTFQELPVAVATVLLEESPGVCLELIEAFYDARQH